MTKIICEKCGLVADVQHKTGDEFVHSINRKDLVQCAAIQDKIAADGQADVRFLCSDLKEAIEVAAKSGVLSRLH